MKIKKILKSVSYRILLLFIIYYFSSCSQAKHNSSKFEKIDQFIKTGISDSVFPGAVLLFGKEDNILFHKAFGHFTYDPNSSKVQTNSMFDLASVSKVVGTTSAAMLLVQKGRINLDDKVVKHLPEFSNNGKDKIEIKNLLLHNSGLPAFKKYYDTFDSADSVIKDIMNLKLENPPDLEYVYSDLGMIALQKMIEKVSGKSLDQFLEKGLFKPLGMIQTMYNPSKELAKNCVPTEFDDFWRMRLLQGEVHDERAYMLNGVAGHAGLFSTAEDLSKFVITLNNDGMYNDARILSAELIDNWTTRHNEQSSRALGWDTKSLENFSSSGKYFSENSYGHTGYTGTSIWVDKGTNLFIIFLTNRVHPSRKNKKIINFRPLLHDLIYKTVFEEQQN